MNKIEAALCASLLPCAVMAQRSPVVADMDTRLPLAGVAVSASDGQRLTTDYGGRWHSSMPFASATLSKKHYMQRRVDAAELRQDTLFLIPQEVVLDGVVVTAPGLSFDVRRAVKGEIDNACLPKPGAGVNLLGILQMLVPSGKSRAASRAERIKKILDKY